MMILGYIKIICPNCEYLFSECILNNEDYKKGKLKNSLIRKCPKCKKDFDIFSANNGKQSFRISLEPVYSYSQRLKRWFGKLLP
jgi:hypothetical protein